MLTGQLRMHLVMATEPRKSTVLGATWDEQSSGGVEHSLNHAWAAY